MKNSHTFGKRVNKDFNKKKKILEDFESSLNNRRLEKESSNNKQDNDISFEFEITPQCFFLDSQIKSISQNQQKPNCKWLNQCNNQLDKIYTIIVFRNYNLIKSNGLKKENYS